MSLLQLIDDLPTDILLECAKYIYLPPNKLLQEINHYGKVKVSIELLKTYRLNDLIKIHKIANKRKDKIPGKETKNMTN